jgi:two-component system response regulator GlrR
MTMSKARILIVDDDPDLLRLLTFRLEGADYAVESADSAERALAKLSVAIPQLVITDLRMSGMDGMALFENIHKSNPALPVIILTAHGTIPDAVAATQRGVFGYLTKPFDSKDLLHQVEKAVALSGGKRCKRAGAGRERYRQGIAGPGHTQGESARRQTVRGHQLRRHSRATARIGIVRPHEGFLHGCRARLQGPVPGR